MSYSKMGNRDAKLLTKDTQKKRIELQHRVIIQLGYEIFITDGFRTEEEQDDLYAQGRTKPGPIVTYTRNSTHELGIAFDIAFKGDELYPSNHQVWENVAIIGKEVGLNRGYDMRGWDKPHFENNGTPIEKRLAITEKPVLSEQEKRQLQKLMRVNSAFREKFEIKELRKSLHETNNIIRDILS